MQLFQRYQKCFCLHINLQTLSLNWSILRGDSFYKPRGRLPHLQPVYVCVSQGFRVLAIKSNVVLIQMENLSLWGAFVVVAFSYLNVLGPNTFVFIKLFTNYFIYHICYTLIFEVYYINPYLQISVASIGAYPHLCLYNSFFTFTFDIFGKRRLLGGLYSRWQLTELPKITIFLHSLK